MIDDPASDGEFVFATDFYARKFGGRRTGSCTELLRAGVTLTVDDVYRGNPEAGVAGVMRRRGYRVFFAENTLWHSLFGLLFWDELFESELASQQFRLGAALPQGPELRASVCRPDRRQAGCRSIRKCSQSAAAPDRCELGPSERHLRLGSCRCRRAAAAAVGNQRGRNRDDRPLVMPELPRHARRIPGSHAGEGRHRLIHGDQGRGRRYPTQSTHAVETAWERRHPCGNRQGRLPLRPRAGLCRGRRRDDRQLGGGRSDNGNRRG